MKWYIILFLICFLFNKANGQNLYIDDLITSVFFENQSSKKQHNIAFILYERNKKIIKRKLSSTVNFKLSIYKSDSCFISALQKEKELELVVLSIISIDKDTMKINLTYSSTNFESYTSPRGKFLEMLGESEVILKLDRKKSEWKYFKSRNLFE